MKKAALLLAILVVILSAMALTATALAGPHEGGQVSGSTIIAGPHEGDGV
jgi:hypothetical protein